MQLKKVIRRVLGCKENETVADTIYRYKIALDRVIYKKKITVDEFENKLKESGIKNGDNIMIHSSWRSFFNYQGTPNSVIDSVIKIIGKDGTLVMPCYGRNKYYFDVDNDKSAAGVLSEVFRNYNDVYRSHGSHFSCVAYGKEAYKVVIKHELSKYGFDEFSPYSRFVNLNNSKIVMLGLGKSSVKLSLYHLPEMILKDKSKFYQELFKKTYTSYVKYNEKGKIIEKKHDDMLERMSTKPNKKNIKKIYKQKFVVHKKISNIDIVVIDAKLALEYILKENKKGNYMIKLH